MFSDFFSGGWRSMSRTQMLVIAGLGALLAYWLLSSGRNFLSPAWLMAATAIVFIALPLHEFAHAAMAVALGDNTPRYQGRYTLNPLVHIDPMGAILIYVAGFGWAKPVMWNPANINVSPRVGAVLVAIVGPLTNLALAIVALILYNTSLAQSNMMVEEFLYGFAGINVLLFVFNMIPVPPLDGSHVLFAFFPGDTFRLRAQLAQYGMLIIFAVIFFVPGLIQVPTMIIMNVLTSIF